MTARGENGVRRRLNYRAGGELELELSWFAVTDVGRRRENNQDSYVTTPPVFAIADGMGGHSAGEIASAAVVRRLAELGGRELVSEQDIDETLSDAVDDIELDAGDTELGAGTTVTGVVLGTEAEPTWKVFNIGDSRVYQYFKGALSQITVDHSVVQHLIDTGAITEEEAEVHPHANVITRAVGFNEAPIPDYTSLALIPGQRILICSDGLTKELTDVGIQHFLATEPTAESAARSLVRHALENAGRDNVTVVVIDVHAVGDVVDTGSLAGSGIELVEAGGSAPLESGAARAAAVVAAPPRHDGEDVDRGSSGLEQRSGADEGSFDGFADDGSAEYDDLEPVILPDAPTTPRAERS
ncbi:PP2C family protein-serine/threonine phosphatase [Leucobacter chromiiresistens]|uniref:PP2C family protein-serine/threonine phosphatase n=1 Tax=Leucobacter chromiiresistens TaxID=1079994 RepID=UPI000734A1ED|nr:protein phosphatase 2C domain-containing protein [Leucobacter chromiiresistens]